MIWIFVIGGTYLGIYLISKGISGICLHDYKVSSYKKNGGKVIITFTCNKCGKIKIKNVPVKSYL